MTEHNANGGWSGDDWDEWIRYQEDERYRPWEHLAISRPEDSRPDLYEFAGDRYEYEDYEDWRRAFPDLQWDA